MRRQERYALWRDPVILSIVGTLAIHLLAYTLTDAAGVVLADRRGEPAPHFDLIEIEPPEPPPKPLPPPPPVKEEIQPKAEPVPQPQVQPQVRASAPRTVAPAPKDPDPLPPDKTDVPTGGAQVVQMENLGPAAKGVAVARGTPQEHVGRGGTGTGTGSGEGSGSAAQPAPVSVATIKKRALPKGDYGYISAKDYPDEARQLGIEGDVRVRLVVDAEGAVSEAKLLNQLGHGLDERALEQAKKIVFEPARDTDDKAVASVVVWTFHFALPKT